MAKQQPSSDIPKKYYNQAGGAKVVQPDWWNVSEEEACKHVFACCRAIEQRQTHRRQRNVMYARLYGNTFIAGFTTNIYKQPKHNAPAARPTLNVAKSVIDTVSSKIAKNKPRPLFLTQKGSHSQTRRAEKLTQYVAGVFSATKLYERAKLSFRDACIFGTGAIKLYAENGSIQAERILIDEVIADDQEAIYGAPRTKYQRKYVHREVLLEQCGEEHAEDILAAKGGIEGDMPGDGTGDMIYVVEGWHLPSGPEETDGKHVICIENKTLFWEEYNKQYFPIFEFHWTPPVVGFYGHGIIEEILGLQIEINKLLRDIQRAQHLIGVPSIWLENSTVVAKPITNEIGAIYRYSGSKPEFYNPASMANDIYQHVWNLYKRAFEIVGVSELSATLKKPAGIESKVALREYNDIETERFALVGQAWEQFHLELARAVVDMSRDLFAENKKLSINVKGKKFIESIAWKEVDLPDDKFVMDVFPTSFLGNTPSGRFERVQDLIEAGLVDEKYARSLLDFPDIERIVSLDTAAFDIVAMIMESIIEHGEYQPPEPFMDLQLALKMAQSTYLKARMEEVPEDRLELLRRFIDQILVLLNVMTPQQPALPQLGPQQAAAPAELPAAPPSGPGPSAPSTNANGALVQ